jgi:hypothetical protein
VLVLFGAMYLAAAAGFGLWTYSGWVMRGVGRGTGLSATVSSIEPYSAQYRRVRLVWPEGGTVRHGSVPLPVAQGDALAEGRSVRLWVVRAPWTAPVLAVEPTLGRVRAEGAVRLAMGLCFLAACSVVCLRLLRTLARERWMLMRGDVAVGRVTRLRRARVTGWQYAVYEFESPHGVKRGAARRGVGKREAAALTVGTAVFVVYDPARPERNLLWGSSAGAAE